MDEVGAAFTDDVIYWVAGARRIGGEWRGRDAVLRAMTNREFGLGAGRLGLRGRLAGVVRGRRARHRRDPRAQLAPLRTRRRHGPAHLRRAPVPRRPHRGAARLHRCRPLPGASWPATGASCPSSRRAELPEQRHHPHVPRIGRGVVFRDLGALLRRLQDQRDAPRSAGRAAASRTARVRSSPPRSACAGPCSSPARPRCRSGGRTTAARRPRPRTRRGCRASAAGDSVMSCPAENRWQVSSP